MRFQDVFTMINPAAAGADSAMTEGAIRLGKVARQLLQATPEHAVIVLHGKFAELYREGCRWLAEGIAAGLMGWEAGDRRIPDALLTAEQASISIELKIGSGSAVYPSAIKLLLSAAGRKASLAGSLLGEGRIEVMQVGDYDVKFTAQYPTLLVSHKDRVGMLAEMTCVLSNEELNIGYVDVDRKSKDGEALTVLEIDHPIPPRIVRLIAELPDVVQVVSVDLTKGE